MTEFELQIAEYQGYLAKVYRMAQKEESPCRCCVNWDNYKGECRYEGCKNKTIYDRFLAEIKTTAVDE